jgi:hypothetical protein
MLIIKLWLVGHAPNGTPIYAFFWKDTHCRSQGRFMANSKRTYIKMSRDKKFQLEKHTRWSIQVQLLALLRELDEPEFNQWLYRFYPNLLD